MSKIYADYILVNQGEIFKITKNSENANALPILHPQPLGTCYCSLLNAIDKLENYVAQFKNKYCNISNIDQLNLNTIIRDLKKISPYFEILSIDLNSSSNMDINKLNHILEYTIMILKKADAYYNDLKNGKQTFGLPSMTIIQSADKTTYFKSYNITNILNLLYVSAYTLFNNKYHLKKCLYCGKYFVTTKGQTRFCDNPSPINPLKTCKQIPKMIYNDDDDDKIPETDLSRSIYSLEPIYCRIKTNFYDSNKKETDNEKKEFIMQNRKYFMTIVKKLKKEIKGSSEANSKYLIKVYSDFLATVEHNLKLSSKQFKVDPPKYKLK